MLNWINDKILINCLAGSKENAKAIHEVSNDSVLIGVLSKNYNSTEEAINDMKEYKKLINDNISVGLGAGDPSMWNRVAHVSREIQPPHVNQIFTATGFTRGLINNKDIIVNSLISPSGKVGFVKISTGEFSSKLDDAIVPVETAVAMLKEQGADSIKFFNMKGLKHIDEFKELAKYCAKHNLILEPTGGISFENFDEIIKVAVASGVKKIIVHVYSSIIDKSTGQTKIEDVKELLKRANALTK